MNTNTSGYTKLQYFRAVRIAAKLLIQATSDPNVGKMDSFERQAFSAVDAEVERLIQRLDLSIRSEERKN